MVCTGNADSTSWQAVRVRGCNTFVAQTVIPRVKRGSKSFFTINNSGSEMSKPNS